MSCEFIYPPRQSPPPSQGRRGMSVGSRTSRALRIDDDGDFSSPKERCGAAFLGGGGSAPYAIASLAMRLNWMPSESSFFSAGSGRKCTA